MDICTMVPARSERPKLLTLPAEIRIRILEYVFADNTLDNGLRIHDATGEVVVDERYRTAALLQPLSICQQFHADGVLLAFTRTTFVANSLFVANIIPERLSMLHEKQTESIRSVSFVADARHFRKLVDWGEHAFGLPALKLDTLTIVLHRSSFWHYLFDFTTGIARLLRHLKAVRRLVFVRNRALVKGSFKAWCNRLIGLMMKFDHQGRYDKTPAELESVWWTWAFDDTAQSFSLEAKPTKDMVDEETYMQQILPLMEALRDSIESEEWNPDPRSRNGA
ncbi:hypothetical protein LTR91_014476 [Friedmanniomyces endolithicus]|uniref:Uncharacterized protein n=2 Tax=Friedmanniomyces endolithicus TaxID=329885 RepID=A0AAN6KBW4_9PEZI|nr:hypothetical protein LTS09_014095 [Friedmanniomyces endolithicus]KAK0279720.1 hypothetical protein LTR35_008443 [Friedmanniomyces endolithicus]KAK0294806.1 hypothetical protein LTS00_006641 [Friedmanniomyces endolithicus]KAK0322506.1 hypothetical protein LTR82_006465 [Friedmanniomyces endolithicus]KAK0969933.1 hypothetical protein LTS01_016059 [Friedmanniomyces endolithicus]